MKTLKHFFHRIPDRGTTDAPHITSPTLYDKKTGNYYSLAHAVVDELNDAHTGVKWMRLTNKEKLKFAKVFMEIIAASDEHGEQWLKTWMDEEGIIPDLPPE